MQESGLVTIREGGPTAGRRNGRPPGKDKDGSLPPYPPLLP